MDRRLVVGLRFNFMAERRSMRIMDQDPRSVRRQRRRNYCEFHRLRIGRAGVQVIRHRYNRKQNADHAYQRDQSNRCALRVCDTETSPQQQQSGSQACPNKIECEFHSLASRICYQERLFNVTNVIKPRGWAIEGKQPFTEPGTVHSAAA